MTAVSLPCIDFQNLLAEVNEERFTSNRIRLFAQRRISEIQEIHEGVARTFQKFQDGNKASKYPILSYIENISLKCTKGYPNSKYFLQLEQLKLLLLPIKNSYEEFQLNLTKDDREKKERKKSFLSNCDAKKSQLLRNEQAEYHKSLLFTAFLEKIKEKYAAPRKNIYFAYAWPSDELYERESWIQPFLKKLQDHLKRAGFLIVELDIVSNRHGKNINTFMEGARTSGYVLLFGTESLLDKYSRGISAVCTELIHIMRKREDDGKKSADRVFPILLSGEHRSAFPPEYERFSTIRDWRDHSYLHNFQQLFLELLGVSPEHYQPKLIKYWNETCRENPQEIPPISDWFQGQRETVEKCKRNKDLQALSQVEVECMSVRLIERLREHYTTRSTISIFTFKKKGKWERSLPINTLYTKLALITEDEREERKDPTTLEDEDLPTHEAIFKAKKEVGPDTIFQEGENKRVVIYGSAGIGKTTFVTMLLYKWAKGKLLEKFKTVLCVRLRNLTTNFYPNAPGYTYHAVDILKKEYESLGVDSFDSECRTTLLILDGWDELPPETRSGGHLSVAFQELQDNYKNILITSRPGSVDIDRPTEFEILGFSTLQIMEYITQYFKSEPDKSRTMQRFIEQNALVKSLAHIPINLSILCALFEENETLLNDSLSITGLYDRLTNEFYKIFLLRREVNPDELRFSTVLSLHNDVAPLVSCLEEIAYNAVEAGVIYTSERDMAKAAYGRQLKIEDVKNLGFFRFENQQGSFIHLTFQEYFAASYIAKLYETKKTRFRALKLIKKHKFNPKFTFTLSMVAGILSFSENQWALQDYFDDLHEKPRDLAELYELSLLARCFEECNDPSKLSQYGDFLEKIKNFIQKASWKMVIVPLFRGNRKLIAEPRLVALFMKLLSQEKTRLDFLHTLEEITSYSNFLPSEIIKKLEKFLYRKDTQRYIFPILKNVGGEKTKQSLISFIKNPKINEFVRFKAVTTIGQIATKGERIGHDRAETLISLLYDPKLGPAIHSSIARTFGNIALRGEKIGDEGIEILISLIKDPKVDLDVRDAAAMAIGNIASAGKKIGEEQIETLISLIKNPKVDQGVRDAVVRAIGKIASAGEKIGDKGIKTLISLIQHPKIHQNIYSSVARTLGEIVSKGEKIGHDGIEALISLLQYPRVYRYVRDSAATAIGKIASAGEKVREEQIETLISLIIDPNVDVDVCDAAAMAIGNIASAGEKIEEEQIEILISLIIDPNADQVARDSATTAIGNIASARGKVEDRVIKILVSLLNNPKANNYVRYSVVTTIGNIASAGGKIGHKGIETLVSTLKSPKISNHVRYSIATAIGNIASSGEQIEGKGINTLISLLKNPQVNNYVCYSIATAIGKIASSGKKIGNKGIETLTSLLKSPKANNYTLCSLATAIGCIASAGEKIGHKGIESLVSLLSDPKVNNYVLDSAATAIGNIASAGEKIGDKGIETLISFLKSPKTERSVCSSIVKSLEKIVSSGEKIREKRVKTLASILKNPKVEKSMGNSAYRVLEKIPSSLLISYSSQNVELLKLYCAVNHRALIKENGSWTISSKIE